VRNNVEHLPSAQQDELERVKQILMDEFSNATARATQPWKKNGRIQNIILFGSYARDDWVDDAAAGYQSDFDILVIVSHKDLTDVAEYWYAAEDRIQRDPAIARQVNIIVHTLEEVNEGLARGEYFWVDIARDGIMLYELPGSALATPKPQTSGDAHEMAATYFVERHAKIDDAIEIAEFCVEKGKLNDAAFMLHQAVERAYRAAIQSTRARAILTAIIIFLASSSCVVIQNRTTRSASLERIVRLVEPNSCALCKQVPARSFVARIALRATETTQPRTVATVLSGSGLPTWPACATSPLRSLPPAPQPT